MKEFQTPSGWNIFSFEAKIQTLIVCNRAGASEVFQGLTTGKLSGIQPLNLSLVRSEMVLPMSERNSATECQNPFWSFHYSRGNSTTECQRFFWMSDTGRSKTFATAEYD